MYDKLQERELEKALIAHIKKFLLELGKGFAYVGNQYKIKVSESEYILDVLFTSNPSDLEGRIGDHLR